MLITETVVHCLVLILGGIFNFQPLSWLAAGADCLAPFDSISLLWSDIITPLVGLLLLPLSRLARRVVKFMVTKDWQNSASNRSWKVTETLYSNVNSS